MTRLSLILASTAAALCLSTAVRADDSELTVFDWTSFDQPELWQDYVTKNGDKPTFAFFADDDEAFQKLSTGFKADVAHPCASKIASYRDAGLIEPWDVSRIPEFKNIAPNFLDSKVFKDDGGVWYIPTDYAYTAIAYNTKEVPAEDVSTLEVFKNPKYAGRISLPDNTDDVWSLALLATGVHDWTNLTEDQFTAAAQWLRDVHPNVRSYWSDPSELSQLMASGEVQVAWSWNDAIPLLREANFPVGFQREAKEGAATWFCGYVNLKDAPGSEDKAYDYINAFLAPNSAKGLLEKVGYSSTNVEAMKTISAEELKENFMDPVHGILHTQTPLDQAMRARMLEEFENIKAGF
ncbi:MAG: extracellular solute-binding protein [Paracoccaceae bacterium]